MQNLYTPLEVQQSILWKLKKIKTVESTYLIF